MTDLYLSFHTLLPEIFLTVFASLMLVLGAARGQADSRTFALMGVNALAGLGLALLILWLGLPQGDVVEGFGGMVILDPFARFIKTLVLLAAMAAVALSLTYMREESERQFELYPLMLLSVVGMLLMTSANHWLVLYIGAELQALPLYVLAAFRRDSVRSTEAGLKYFVLGALSSGMLLYGISLIYGSSGVLSFADLAAAIASGEVKHLVLVVGMVLVLAGLAFKLSAAPFHMWTPDVYEGAPTAVTAFFALAPKLAAFAILMRVLTGPLAGITPEWQQIIGVLAALSTIWGAFAALRQNNLKRLLAYSSIGHIGYALMGVVTATPQGMAATTFYLALYVLTTAGAFACLLAMRRGGRYVETVDDLAGVVRTNPLFAYGFAALLLSMAGIPPIAGFFAKLYVFQAAVSAGFYSLAVIGVLSSVVAAAYYLRVCKVMFFDEPFEALDRTPDRAVGGIMAGSAVLSVVFLVYPAPQLLALSQTVVAGLFGG
jgi:NADH-quinone oxidoreductase subunit N